MVLSKISDSHPYRARTTLSPRTWPLKHRPLLCLIDLLQYWQLFVPIGPDLDELNLATLLVEILEHCNCIGESWLCRLCVLHRDLILVLASGPNLCRLYRFLCLSCWFRKWRSSSRSMVYDLCVSRWITQSVGELIKWTIKQIIHQRILTNRLISLPYRAVTVRDPLWRHSNATIDKNIFRVWISFDYRILSVPCGGLWDPLRALATMDVGAPVAGFAVKIGGVQSDWLIVSFMHSLIIDYLIFGVNKNN